MKNISSKALTEESNKKESLKKNEKNEYIQILRAVAIIAVVAIHDCPEGGIGVYIRPFVNFCVALFLFLSGYLTKEEKMKDVSSFMHKRIWRVMIPYVVWSIAYALIRDYSWNVFLYKFFTAQCCGVFYYIIVYVQMVILTPLLYKISHTKYSHLVYLITPISIISTYIYVLNDNTLEYPFYILTFAQWIAYYYLGLAFHFRERPPRCMQFLEKTKRNGFILVGFYVLSMIFQFIESFSWYDNGRLGMAKTQVKISTMIASVAMIMLLMYIKNIVVVKRNNFFVMIGNYSFGIYLTHMLIIDLLNDYTIFNYVSAVVLVIIIDVILISVCNYLLPKRILRYVGFA